MCLVPLYRVHEDASVCALETPGVLSFWVGLFLKFNSSTVSVTLDLIGWEVQIVGTVVDTFAWAARSVGFPGVSAHSLVYGCT